MRLAIAILLVLEAVAASIPTEKDIGELDVGLEFFEFDLEDKCVEKNRILWDFYRGIKSGLEELVTQKISEAKLVKNEATKLEKFKSVNITVSRTARKLNMLFSSGATMMENNTLHEMAVFATTAQVASVQAIAGEQTKENELRQETDPERLAHLWKQWAEIMQNNSADLTQQISLLDLEAEANGAESTEKYWLLTSEVTTIDYNGLIKLWEPLIPLYQKLQKLIFSKILENFGPQRDPANIPVHLLGSFESSDWTTAAEKLNIFEESKTYSQLISSLKNKKIQDLYRASDEITAELNLGYLPDEFFENSLFEAEHGNCVHFMEATCRSDVTPRVINCKSSSPSVTDFLRAHKEVGRIKHHAKASEIDKGQGFLLREGPKDSVLYEAISTATSLLAIHPDNLLKRHLIDTKEKDANITSLLIAALHIIPPLPLHLTYDIWRLRALSEINRDDETLNSTVEESTNAFTSGFTDDSWINSSGEKNESSQTTEKTFLNETVTPNVTTIDEPSPQYDRVNLTHDWWALRKKYQGVVPPDSQLYEDYLQDSLVVWNRPHISKFLGPILLFQILENFKTGNTSENQDLLHRLLRKGKSEPWEIVVSKLFNITSLDSKPLLKYFAPLETFLDDGAQFGTAKSNVSGNDVNLFLRGTSLRAGGEEKGLKTASEDSTAIMVVLVGLAVIGSAAVIVSVLRQKFRKRRQKRERARFGEE